MQNPKRYAEIAIDACQLPVVPDESKQIIKAARETPCELKVVWDQKQHTIDKCNQAKFQKWTFLYLFLSNHPIFQKKMVTFFSNWTRSEVFIGFETGKKVVFKRNITNANVQLKM